MTMETVARILLAIVIAIGALAVVLLLATREIKRAAREYLHRTSNRVTTGRRT